jgi:RNA recognition motif-containing protein
MFGGGDKQFMPIYIGNLSHEATREDLSKVFKEYGTVKPVNLPIDRQTGHPHGFAFIELGTEAEEDKAISDLDDAEWMGRELKVDRSRPRER